MLLGQSRPPPGLRLYAIGDIHGCLGMLLRLHARIADDLQRDPPERHLIVHLGDYTDRGPDSAGVVDQLARWSRERDDMRFLRGNHDLLFMEFLQAPYEVAAIFLRYGGVETLRSYGVVVRADATADSLAADARAKVPPAHLAFLSGTAVSTRLGDYFFCHAGIRPGVPLDRQVEDDLLWIREPWLGHTGESEAVVVHGHTPATAPEALPTRINVDTGAVFGGPLTAVRLDGTAYSFLQEERAAEA